MDMDKAFIYGMSVEGKNFTDRDIPRRLRGYLCAGYTLLR